MFMFDIIHHHGQLQYSNSWELETQIYGPTSEDYGSNVTKN
jgi:hypothetical protein